MAKYVVRGEYPQRNALGSFGSEWQSDKQFASIQEAFMFAKADKSSFNIRIHKVIPGANGADYPVVRRVKN